MTTPGPQNRTQGDLKKIGRPADDAAWQVGGTMAARPFKYLFSAASRFRATVLCPCGGRFSKQGGELSRLGDRMLAALEWDMKDKQSNNDDGDKNACRS